MKHTEEVKLHSSHHNAESLTNQSWMFNNAIEYNAIGTTWHCTDPSMASQLMRVSEWSILTCERHMPPNLLVIGRYVLLNMCDKINPILISHLEKCVRMALEVRFLRKVGNKQLAVIMSRCSTRACGKSMHRCILWKSGNYWNIYN